MKPKDYEVIYKFTVALAVPFPSALNWNAEPIGELIRCKDCVHFKQSEVLGNTCALTDNHVTKKDYCSKAERKEE